MIPLAQLTNAVTAAGTLAVGGAQYQFSGSQIGMAAGTIVVVSGVFLPALRDSIVAIIAAWKKPPEKN